MFKFEVFDANGRRRVYEGITRYQAYKSIPLRNCCKTYLAIVGFDDVWVVQVGKSNDGTKINGFKALQQWYDDEHGMDPKFLPIRVFELSYQTGGEYSKTLCDYSG